VKITHPSDAGEENGTQISHVYRHEPLSREVLSALNPDVSLSEMTDDLTEIGYPTAWRDSRWP